MMFDFFSKICKHVKNWTEAYKYKNQNSGITKINKISENLYTLNIKYEYLLRIIKPTLTYILLISITASHGQCSILIHGLICRT